MSKYVPVPVKLEPRESINSKLLGIPGVTRSLIPSKDMGLLRVEVISAGNLRAADRGGNIFTRHAFLRDSSCLR
jgi:hypothetical protein